MDTHEFIDTTFKPKTTYLWGIYEELPLHFTYINGLDLSLSSDIGGYTILCGEMLQYAHKVSTFIDFTLASHLTVLSQNTEYFKLNIA